MNIDIHGLISHLKQSFRSTQIIKTSQILPNGPFVYLLLPRLSEEASSALKNS